MSRCALVLLMALAGCPAPARRAPRSIEARTRHFTRFRGMPITLLVSTPLPGTQGERLLTTLRSRLNDAMTASGVVFTEDAPLTIKVSIDRYGFGPMSEGWRCVTLRWRVVRGGHDFAAIDETAERCLAQPGPTTNGSAWSGSDADLETALDIVKDPEGAAALQLAFEAALEELLNQLDR